MWRSASLLMVTALWSAIEKFAYPQWSHALLCSHPAMLMRMQPETYMLVAGFVEFNLTFVLLGAASVVGRLVAVGLQAIFQFGLLDAIGHLMIMLPTVCSLSVWQDGWFSF